MWIQFEWMLAGILLLSPVVQAQSSVRRAPNEPLMSTGVTGSIRASGLGDPQYVLSFVPIQRLMLDATRHPLTIEEIEKGTQGTPVTLDHLLRLELLRKDGDKYWLNYLLLTTRDQRTIYSASAGAIYFTNNITSRKREFGETYIDILHRPVLKIVN